MEVEIRLIEKEKLEMIIPLLARLNPNIQMNVLEHRLVEMKSQGYQCVGIFEGNILVGISGIWLLTKYYVGRHIEPDNVYILPEYRGKGLGEKLMEWIFEYAKSQGCSASELNCYVKNKAGQRFWKRQGYKILGYHYQKQL
ncbi:GNAT family N-acetyltransferase [Pareuzebyella sediminis]|uniref:GNAT family N-acetyltransferase n=1 Tax=Pareuzebyella sediminis TaxID=2607998 RepID=UPI0011EE8A25|nr:GNAT family N-acetyltransferase [Pareuzebyella sediminis]